MFEGERPGSYGVSAGSVDGSGRLKARRKEARTAEGRKTSERSFR